mgnify:CR=1 FL=1
MRARPTRWRRLLLCGRESPKKREQQLLKMSAARLTRPLLPRWPQLSNAAIGRTLSEGELRQLSAKLEESLRRETVALRADNADLRASLTEALRICAEERKEREKKSRVEEDAQSDTQRRI